MTDHDRALARHALASVDGSDVFGDGCWFDALDASEQQALAERSAAFWDDTLRRDLDAMAVAQLRFIAERASDMDQLMYARGTLNGLALIRELYEERCAATVAPRQERQQEREDT